jgi:hypothetical protein
MKTEMIEWYDATEWKMQEREFLEQHTPTELLTTQKTPGTIVKEDDNAVVVLRHTSKNLQADLVSFLVIPKKWIKE